MGSPAICQKHGRVFYVATSPTLATAIADNIDLSTELSVVTLEIDSEEELGKTTKNLLDPTFLMRFSQQPTNGLLKLKDRSKKEKLTNDRLLIKSIFSETIMVCPCCLDDLVSRHREQTAMSKPPK